MNKNYYERGQTVTIDELETIIAIEVGKGNVRPGRAWARLRQALLAQAEDDEQRAEVDAQLSAFVRAGWRFEPRTAEMETAVAGARRRLGPNRLARVFIQQPGRLLLETDQLTVGLVPGLHAAECHQVLEHEGLDVIRRLEFAPNLFEVKAPPGVDPLDVSMQLRDRSGFEYAEPQFLEHIGPRREPTDLEIANMWHFTNIGAREAWRLSRGERIRLAVIDNGMDLDHLDLTDAVEPSSGFFNSTGNFIRSRRDYPKVDHGTLCAGIAVARANNGHDGCGVAFEARLIAISCFPDEVGTQATLARAVSYAADPRKEVANAEAGSGAHVISCSLSLKRAAGTSLLQAIDFAVQKGRGGQLGTPVFWAVANANREIATDEVCFHPNVIAVGRSTEGDLHGGNSAFGSKLEFLAPGVKVRSTQIGGGLATVTGTSFATPIAAAIAALVLSVDDTLKADDVRKLLRDNCDQVGNVTYVNGRHRRYGHGRVNAARAVDAARRRIESAPTSDAVSDVPCVSMEMKRDIRNK